MSTAERVGQLLGNDLAGRVIECFDFCVIQNRVAACVSVRWSTAFADGCTTLWTTLLSRSSATKAAAPL